MFDVTGDAWVGDPGVSAGVDRDRHHLGQVAPPGRMQAVRYGQGELADAGLRGVGPFRFRDDVDLPSVEPV
jgi:hypothetical protein